MDGDCALVDGLDDTRIFERATTTKTKIKWNSHHPRQQRKRDRHFLSIQYWNGKIYPTDGCCCLLFAHNMTLTRVQKVKNCNRVNTAKKKKKNASLSNTVLSINVRRSASRAERDKIKISVPRLFFQCSGYIVLSCLNGTSLSNNAQKVR